VAASPDGAWGGQAPSTRPAAELLPVNVLHMLSGYCHAGSRVEDSKAPGGYWASDNFPTIFEPQQELRQGEVYLTVDPLPAAFEQQHQGITLRLVNGTDRRVAFRASDSRLSIVQEAREDKGQWREIEYLPQSWCGNSYHRVFLDPGQCWTFAAPKYEGRLKTKLRFKLMVEEQAIHSEEFDGSINPEQFGVQRPHGGTDLMDPYAR
jgi:hypothetical protein